MGLQPAPMGIPAPGPEEQKRPPGSAGRPMDRLRLWGSLGPIARIELSEGHRRPLLLSVTQGNGTPGKLDLYGQIRCLPRQRQAGASDPGRHEDLMQTRNRLRICSCPAHALPVLLVPPPGGPTACPDGKQTTRPRGIKVAPQEAQDRPGTAPQLREDLGYSNQRAADGLAAAPSNAMHQIPDGLGDPAKPAIVCGFGSPNDGSVVAFMSHICCTAI